MKKVVFKDDVDPRDIWKFTELCKILFMEVMTYCENHDILMTITSLQSDRKHLKLGVHRKSSTHEDGRAFDIRTRDMMADEAMDMVIYFNHQFKNIAAISSSTGEPRCAVLKKDHIHFQVRRN